MKIQNALLITLVMSVLMTACTSANIETSTPPTMPQPSATTIKIQPSATIPPTEAATPTLIPPTSGEQADITLDYSAVAQDVTVETVAAVPLIASGPVSPTAPQYRRLTLQGYPISNHNYKPQLFIYPVGDLALANKLMDEVATDLQDLLQSQQTSHPLPFLPLINSQQAFQAQVQYLDFVSGKGVRYLTQLNQGLVPINNQELIFTFQGLSNDGNYYISAILPVTNPELPAGAEQSAEFIKGLTDTPGFYQDYISQTITLLDQQPADGFTPDLSKLDALLSSITIPPFEATTTPEIFIPAPLEGVLADKTREDLSTRLGVDFASISVLQVSPQDWPDVCLGLAPTPNQECTKNIVPGWRIILNAVGHTHEYRATADGSLISYSGPVTVAGPDACNINGTSLIYSPEDGYCFAYPVRFHRTDERGPIAIYGPAYGPGPEPLYAALTVEISSLPEGQTLDEAANAFLAQLGDVPMPQTRLAGALPGEPSIMLEVVPGMLGSRDVLIIHDGKLFHFTFWPAPSVVTETAADVEDLYQTVLSSLTFLP